MNRIRAPSNAHLLGQQHSQHFRGSDVIISGAGDDPAYGVTIPCRAISPTSPAAATGSCSRTAAASDSMFDFEDGRDVIDLTLPGISGIADINSHRSQVGADVVIDLGYAADGARTRTC